MNNANLIDEFTEGNELLLRSETNRPADLIALQFYVSGGLLQVHLVVGDTTGGGKSTVSRALHNTDAMLETITLLTHGKLHYGIQILD